MAPLIDSSESTSGTALAVITWSHTVTTSLADRLLVIQIGGSANPQPDITGVEYPQGTAVDGGEIYERKQTSPPFRRTSSQWYDKDPATGANTVEVNLDIVFDEFACGSVSYTGADQTTPLGTSVDGLANDATPTVTVTTATGEIVSDHLWCQHATAAPGADQTTQWEEEGVDGDATGSCSTQDGADGGVMSYTMGGTGNDRWVMGAVPIKPVAAVAERPPLPQFTHSRLQVGHIY